MRWLSSASTSYQVPGLEELTGVAGLSLGDSGYLALDGAGPDSSVPGIFVAGCGSGPITIPESINQAKTAADAAVSQLNPILLDGESDEGDEGKAPPPDDDMRVQIEKLLNALIDASR